MDFGDKHTISDKNGEEIRNCIVVDITQEETAFFRIYIINTGSGSLSRG